MGSYHSPVDVDAYASKYAWDDDEIQFIAGSSDIPSNIRRSTLVNARKVQANLASKGKRKALSTSIKRPIEITISDDDEIQVVAGPSLKTAPPRKKKCKRPQTPELKPLVQELTDSELSDDEFHHTGFSDGRWNDNVASAPRLSLGQDQVVNPPPHQPALANPRQNGQVTASKQRLPTVNLPNAIWDQLSRAKGIRHPVKDVIPMRFPFLSKNLFRGLRSDLNLSGLYCVTSCKRSSGSIGTIEQRAGWTIVTSACIGGLADTPGEVEDHYNKPGSLLILGHETIETPECHGKKKKYKHGEVVVEYWKNYTVNDAKFGCSSDTFVSTAQDKTVLLWRRDATTATWSNISKKLSHVPHDIAFNHGGNVFAIAEKEVHLYDINSTDNTLKSRCSFPLTRSGNGDSHYYIASMVWDLDNRLYVSNEAASNALRGTGTHIAWDVNGNCELYKFSVHEEGDCLGIDSTGRTVALVTQTKDSGHRLHMFDVYRQQSKPMSTTTLEAFHPRTGGGPDPEPIEGEHNAVAFSPDGVYVALARNDNSTQVFDTRMLGASERHGTGLVAKYRHTGSLKTLNNEGSFGVTNAIWVQSARTQRMALLTAGEDGCVRMWDPSKAEDVSGNGVIVAEVNSDIGQFSVGDPWAGEHRLIVGDSSGELSVFDRPF